ncbi:MAG: SPASM domain-containing protein [Phycisphaerae bacterium]
MKTIATVAVDLERSPLGTRSRLADDLRGKPVLRRTVERLLRARRLDAIHVLTPARQARAAAQVLTNLDVRMETHSEPSVGYAGLVRAGRVWGLDGWRGGIGSVCAFDEDLHLPLVAALAERESAAVVVSIPAAAAVIDAALIDAMIDHHAEQTGDTRLTIIQAPPGLGLVILDRTLLAQMAPTQQPIGVILTYRPDQPVPDLTGKPACYRPPVAVVEARGRLLCDTRRAFERVEALLNAGGDDWDAERIAGWLLQREATHVADVPEEIEIELTTTDASGSGSILHPRGDRVGTRGPISLDLIRAVIDGLTGYDDVRIVLGGFGDPCTHPAFGEICRMFRASDAMAIAVRTDATVEAAPVEAALFETPVDVVEVTIDAACAETYRRVWGSDRLAEVSSRIERWIERRFAGNSVLPLIVPSLVKANESLPDMEPFFDAWMRRLGMVLVTGYSHCAGQLERRAVTAMAPQKSDACRRTFSRLLVLADGTVTTCDQDFAGRQSVGSLRDAPLVDLWRSERLSRIRRNDIDSLPLCPTCDEWHRP